MSLNTNLGSLFVQSNLSRSTMGLNQAIERMTTGFKINHAKDNSANYFISTSLSSQLSSYSVAQDNVAMGLDMLTTAMDSLSLLSSHVSRIRDLAEQASNGTYGQQSLDAIQSEITARLDECSRLVASTEYNGIKLFDGSSASGSKFVQEVVPLTEDEALAQGYTVIKTADELQAIKNNLSGKYILMNDISLFGYDWEAIGDSGNAFTGEFNGNGYVISNLTINKPNEQYQGLFGYVYGGTVENIGLENINVSGAWYTGGLVGYLRNSSIINSYSTGSVFGEDYVGGLAGTLNRGNITNSSSAGTVNGRNIVGGIAGDVYGRSSIINSYTTADTTGSRDVGGLIGYLTNSSITDCHSIGSVTGDSYVGGLTGYLTGSRISNSYSEGSVMGDTYVGGLAGYLLNSNNIANSYTKSSVSGNSQYGAFAGYIGTASCSITTSVFYSSINPGLSAVGWNYGGADLSGLSDGGVPPASSSQQKPVIITFQTGIYSAESSQITADLGFSFELSVDISSSDSARNSLTLIDEVLADINAKQTEYGAVYNRLESALESIDVSIENLISSRSTLRDADIAKESSEYIRYQILQQASATLLATANQTPSIALQLL